MYFKCNNEVWTASRHMNRINVTYVTLWDPGSMQYSHIIEQSPRDWETTMHQNVVLKIVHTKNIYHHVWKTVRTTLQIIVGLQSQGEGHEMERKICGTNLFLFLCFSNILLGIGERQNFKVWLWEISMHGDVYFVCGKLSELHFETQVSPNRKETVL